MWKLPPAFSAVTLLLPLPNMHSALNTPSSSGTEWLPRGCHLWVRDREVVWMALCRCRGVFPPVDRNYLSSSSLVSTTSSPPLILMRDEQLLAPRQPTFHLDRVVRRPLLLGARCLKSTNGFPQLSPPMSHLPPLLRCTVDRLQSKSPSSPSSLHSARTALSFASSHSHVSSQPSSSYLLTLSLCAESPEQLHHLLSTLGSLRLTGSTMHILTQSTKCLLALVAAIGWADTLLAGVKALLLGGSAVEGGEHTPARRICLKIQERRAAALNSLSPSTDWPLASHAV